MEAVNNGNRGTLDRIESHRCKNLFVFLARMFFSLSLMSYHVSSQVTFLRLEPDMNLLARHICLLLFPFAAIFCDATMRSSTATDLARLNQENWSEFAPRGKEVDAIFGDIILRNDRIVAVIAQPKDTRNANMTVRNVGGCVIDLTNIKFPNDQLSCFYPTSSKFQFHSEDGMKITIDGAEAQLAGDAKLSGTSATIEFKSTSGPANLSAIVRYTLKDGAPFVTVETVFENRAEQPASLKREDGMRADRTFSFGSDDSLTLFWADDPTFNQAYGILAEGYRANRAGDRGIVIGYAKDGSDEMQIAKDQSEAFSRKLFPAGNVLQVKAIARRTLGEELKNLELTVSDDDGPVRQAAITVKQDEKVYGTGRTNAQGKLFTALSAGSYELEVTAIGRPELKTKIELNQPMKTEIDIHMEQAGYVQAKITDEAGKTIPCKVAFWGTDGTPNPDYGHESLAIASGNLRYSMGNFTQPIGPGMYEAVVSRGPEYDAVVKKIEVKRGEKTLLEVQLPRVVDTSGWISADFHSHSSPSGDNTSDQHGRVLNLLAEHIEFAPCTEHNRIDTYVPHLKQLKAEQFMATCSGMELTGSLLPVNHQNSFPLMREPHTQDGGAPVTDGDPELQIERLAMWDNNSDKLVQTNHPNLIQIYGDRDTNGEADQGFRKMLGFMDVMEVHPPATIFEKPAGLPERGTRGNVIFNWMQLLNLGYRIPGVVNTDAHYNFHGSGGLRNFIKCDTDDPAGIDTMEMVHASERGNIVMSTGPFLEVELTSKADDKTSRGTAGDDVQGFNGKAELAVKVQCPNWFDVNRVQVFLNGRPDESLNFTRRTHPEMFADGVVKFAQTIPLTFKEDTHVIVATIGEGLKIGRIMGPSWGEQPPVAVANPIFVDIDGNGFKPNGDLLGGVLLGAQAPAND